MMEPSKPFIISKPGGHYSTVRLPDGVIETVWFSEDGSAVTVGRTCQGIRETAEKHIAAYESKEG